MRNTSYDWTWDGWTAETEIDGCKVWITIANSHHTVTDINEKDALSVVIWDSNGRRSSGMYGASIAWINDQALQGTVKDAKENMVKDGSTSKTID